MQQLVMLPKYNFYTVILNNKYQQETFSQLLIEFEQNNHL